MSQKKKKVDQKKLLESEKLEVKYTKSFTKREWLEDKMIEFINLTKKNEPEIKKDDWISLQLEAMGKSMYESLTKRQQYGCLHEMQGVVFRYVSSQLDRQEGQQMAP